jgi:ATP adenylyltransferase
MDRLWTPWRYNYISGAKAQRRKGVPEELDAWPGEDRECVFCNLIESVRWGAKTLGMEAAEKAGHVVRQFESCFVCLNAFPYSSGHLLIVPYRHTDSLVTLPVGEAEEMMRVTQKVEAALREVYRPDGINLGMNLGEAAGAGVAGHLHMHGLPRWFGDTNFMTVTAETRVLPEMLDVSWARVRAALAEQTWK